MLKTITKSSNKKLGGCAATYRAGVENVFSTCPNTCELKLANQRGSDSIDQTYLNALISAVPIQGVAWTYTHFPKEDIPLTGPGQTCINISTDSPQEAVESIQSGHPTVVVMPSTYTNKVDTYNSIRFIRCPAEYSDEITCNNCGGDVPLCARQNRDYVIKFTAHGSQAKIINQKAETTLSSGSVSGGCYGTGGPVRLQWEKTKGTTESDAEILTEFVSKLPVGTKLRHHVVGDLG